MKKLLIFVILITATTCLIDYAPVLYGADEEYLMGDVRTLPANFDLEISASGDNKKFNQGAQTVNGVCTFHVARPGGADATVYDISMFENNKFAKLYNQHALPYTVKINFRGKVEGDYQITFVARDAVGITGKGSITIQVRR
jgi:hypothetical protein